MQPQEPRMTTQTTGLLFLPLLSPPKVIIDALKEPSVVARVDTSISVQTTGTPLATEKEEEKKEEEKEETKDKESAIQNLVELPKIGTPTKSLQ